jgi:hypothetical protein
MRRYLILSVPIVILDVLALHDILKGTEPDYSAEYTCLVFSAVIFILIGIRYLHAGKSRQ